MCSDVCVSLLTVTGLRLGTSELTGPMQMRRMMSTLQIDSYYGDVWFARTTLDKLGLASAMAQYPYKITPATHGGAMRSINEVDPLYLK